MNRLFRNSTILCSLLLGTFVCFALLSCEDDPTGNLPNDGQPIDSSLVLIEPLAALDEIEAGDDPLLNGLEDILLGNGMLIIKDQEVLEDMSPDMADSIDIEGKMIILAGVGLSSGSASRVLNLYRNTDDDAYICRVNIVYPPCGTCDAPFVILSNVYPLINEPITYEVVVESM